MPETKPSRGFDYSAPAELFPTRSRKGNRPIDYRRFVNAAEAIRFAIEELPPKLLVGAHLQVEDERFGSDEIRQLCNCADYPLMGTLQGRLDNRSRHGKYPNRIQWPNVARMKQQVNYDTDFPNQSRWNDATLRAVRFCGHDNAMEAMFGFS